MIELCLVFLVKGDKVVLAPKKTASGGRDFLIGKLNGYGGGIKEGESPERALERESKEEGRGGENSKFKIKIDKLKKVAVIYFNFKGEGDRRFKCHTFLTQEWEGEPEESDEMGIPEEFPKDNLPFDRMMPGDIKLFPVILSGKTIEAEVFFSENGEELIDSRYKEVKF